MKELYENSYLFDGNAPYLEALYEDYLQNPNAVSSELRHYFESLPTVTKEAINDLKHRQIQEQFREEVLVRGQRTAPVPAEAASLKQEVVDDLIEAYRQWGHIGAHLDPLKRREGSDSRLELSYYDLSPLDFNSMFNARGLFDNTYATLNDIYKKLKAVYSNTLALEYEYVSDEKKYQWLCHYFEHTLFNKPFEADAKRDILRNLINAETLEKYLDKKYVGQKRFSLEGGESFIPLMRKLVDHGGTHGVKEMVVAMAHRGRLNMLVNVMGKPTEAVFAEFEGKNQEWKTTGDVKYHLGYSSDVETPGEVVHLSLAFNPSHLEFISAVALGSVRSRQDRHTDSGREYAMGIIVHGDSAFSGQGIVMETLNMSQTRAFGVGGSVHVVINNQIGFTSEHPEDSRSSRYCTDIAKLIEAPVLHVNGDDPEAVVKAAQMAMEYRLQFHQDIVIDLVCFRRHGHNEADEPRATNPSMYQRVDAHPGTLALYSEHLIQEKICTSDDVKTWINEYRDQLDQGKSMVRTLTSGGLLNENKKAWIRYLDQTQLGIPVETGVALQILRSLGEKLTVVPSGFELQRQVGLLLKARQEMVAGQRPLDWGCAEMLAYATLLIEGYRVRFSGQDVRRGTFFHRHATIYDSKTAQEFVALQHLSPTQAPFEIYDSILSELGVMGFEYGYASTDPDALVIWEAQFGDFANGAQVIVDQFMSSAWQKWERLAGLTLFLPHGYEGMGPEHSSARLERYLQLCAQYNMQVCIPSTPAQIFHLLRRQMHHVARIPLIVITPKSLLRHKLAVSSLEDLTQGGYQLVIPEKNLAVTLAQTNRVVLCSGKVYYHLLEKREAEKMNSIALVRVEQLYPFPYEEIKAILKQYPHVKKVVWCQEEPKNQGAWFIIRDRIQQCLQEGQTLSYAGRSPMASPAVGYPAYYKQKQEQLVLQALGLENEDEYRD